MIKHIAENPVTFPEGMLWGTATAAHQIEGDNIHSQLWFYETHPELKGFDITGNLPSPKYEEPSGKACDHWNLFEEDFQRMQDAGLNFYRMGIEWCRIEPEEGKCDETAVLHYLEMLKSLKAKKIKVMVTLHHFTHPLWFEQKGAFFKRENNAYFLRWVEKAVRTFGSYVDYWCTFNEMTGAAGVTLEDVRKYGGRLTNMLHAHGQAYRLLKANSSAPIGIAHMAVGTFPLRDRLQGDVLMADWYDYLMNEGLIHALRTGRVQLPFTDEEYFPELIQSFDYWGLNYYYGMPCRIGAKSSAWATYEPLKLDSTWQMLYPQGLIAFFNRLLPDNKPFIITESGMYTEDDRKRIEYLIYHFWALGEGIKQGAKITGYLHWSFMDNYEWGSYKPKYGMHSFDPVTMKRTAKPSWDFFSRVAKENKLTVSPELLKAINCAE